MNEIATISDRAAGRPAAFERVSCQPGARRGSAQAEKRASDRVELSEAASNHDAEVEAARELEQRIRDIRARIADGTYLTPDKLDAVVEQLYSEIVGTDSD